MRQLKRSTLNHMPKFLALLGITLSSGVGIGSATEANRHPNIVLIVADDLGWGDVGFNGRKEWTTPNLDRLARQGTVFQRLYTAAVVCAPSRAAFLTGKYPIHSGVRRNDEDLPTEEVTIAEALKPKGYATALFGKWHHGKARPGSKNYVHPMDQGFDEFFGYTDAVDAWEKFPEMVWSGRNRVAVSGYFDDLITERALEFVKARKAGPFFLYLAPIATHFNIAAPEDEILKHRGKFPEDDPAHPFNAAYAAMITRLDHNIGRLIEALEQLSLSQDTLVVFTSDHGATFESGNLGTSATLDSNHPFRGQKRTLWEGGIRVPGLAYWPGHVPAGVVSDQVTHLTDLLPTFVAAAGGKTDPAWHIDGLDQIGVWTGKVKPSSRRIYWEWESEGARQVAAMEGRFKLVVIEGGKSELYDVVGDPSERRDISAQKPELTKQLREQVRAWLETATHR